jgi:predicted porin
LTLGGSAARGRYLADSVLAAVSLVAGRERSTQRALGADVEYSRDHWLVRGEAVRDQWEMPTLPSSIRASSFFVEGTYKIRPGLFAAARIDTLRFQSVTTPTQTRTWDAPITRLETGVGFYVQRNLVVKVTYQYNRRDGGLVRRRSLAAVQLQFWL